MNASNFLSRFKLHLASRDQLENAVQTLAPLPEGKNIVEVIGEYLREMSLFAVSHLRSQVGQPDRHTIYYLIYSYILCYNLMRIL